MNSTALISVFDKHGLESFGKGLADLGVSILSTGGTARTLRESGVAVRDVSELTTTPEVLDGRVKTLHPKVFAAILADLDNPDHRDVLSDWGVPPISLVVVNLYPFAATASRPGATAEEVIENIDIGGPSMLRAAAKNHRHVTVVSDPSDYPAILEALRSGGTSHELRRRLALKAFRHTALYDTAIATLLPAHIGEESSMLLRAILPAMDGEEIPLRYGENPHQKASLVRGVPACGLAAFRQLQGKELSYNNLVDADGAWRLANDLPAPGVAIIKHASPCGAATGGTAAEAFTQALACDPVSAFGGIVASALAIDTEAAQRMSELFLEVILAPAVSPEAQKILGAKKNLRVLEVPPPSQGSLRVRAVDGGLLLQSADEGWDAEEWRVVTQRSPSEHETRALHLAWRVAKHATSNAVVVARGSATVGIGAGQPSRVDCCRLAISKARTAGLETSGSAAGSDAFFPFPDGIEVLAAGGVTAVAQPGGSVRDTEVIEAANRLGLAMVFTGRRHFRH